MKTTLTFFIRETQISKTKGTGAKRSSTKLIEICKLNELNEVIS